MTFKYSNVKQIHDASVRVPLISRAVMLIAVNIVKYRAALAETEVARDSILNKNFGPGVKQFRQDHPKANEVIQELSAVMNGDCTIEGLNVIALTDIAEAALANDPGIQDAIATLLQFGLISTVKT